MVSAVQSEEKLRYIITDIKEGGHSAVNKLLSHVNFA